MSSIGTCNPLNISDIAFLALPNEQIAEVFSHIHLTDIQSLPLLSKTMRKEVVLYMNGAKCEEVAKFLEKVIHGLDRDRHHKEIESLEIIYSELEEAFSQKPFFSSVFNPGKYSPKKSLVGLKSTIVITKDRIVGVLKDLDDEALNKIKLIPVPSFFENSVELAQISKRIPVTSGVLTESTKKILSDFSVAGGIHQAIGIANILLPVEEVAAIRYIVKTLYSPTVGKMDMAFQVANTQLEENSRIAALLDVIQGALKIGKFDYAIKVAQVLPSDLAVDKLLRIADVLTLGFNGQSDLKKEAVRLAAEAASNISDQFDKTFQLANVAERFLRLEDYDRAKEFFKAAFTIARTLTFDSLEAKALAHIIRAWTGSDKGNQVVACLIPMGDRVKKQIVLRYLIDPITANRRVLTKVKELQDEVDIDDVYTLVIEDLTDQIQAKLRPSSKMPDEDEKS